MPTIGGNSNKPDKNAEFYRIAKKLRDRVTSGDAELPPKDQSFIDSVTARYEKQPFVFSDAQGEWIDDLEEKFL